MAKKRRKFASSFKAKVALAAIRGEVTVDLSAAPGRLAIEWFEPQNGATDSCGEVEGAAPLRRALRWRRGSLSERPTLEGEAPGLAHS